MAITDCAVALDCIQSVQKVEAVASENLHTMISKRAEIFECIRLLEVRARQRSGLAINQLIESLRRRVDWLDGRIDIELQQFGPTERARIAKIRSAQDAA